MLFMLLTATKEKPFPLCVQLYLQPWVCILVPIGNLWYFPHSIEARMQLDVNMNGHERFVKLQVYLGPNMLQ